MRRPTHLLDGVIIKPGDGDFLGRRRMDDDDRHVGLTHAEPVGQDGDDCQLAGPFLGNAITLIFRASPSQPTI